MTKLDERVAGIELRCSPHARALLASLRVDPMFRNLIRALANTTGELSYRDIEDAIIRVRYRRHAKFTPNAYVGTFSAAIE